MKSDRQESGSEERKPDDPSWRADALARSTHTRLSDGLRPPLEDHNPVHAAELCAEISRAALADFAPALILLPGDTRRRAQALIAFTVTLFDFVHQPGIEGERLAAINRWEFELESALSGAPAGQPVFVRIAAEEEQQEWPRSAFDSLVTIARKRATRPAAATVSELERDSRSIGAAFVEGLTGNPCGVAVAGLAGACLRAGTLANLNGSFRNGRLRLPPAAPQTGYSSQTQGDRIFTNQIAPEISRLLDSLSHSGEAISTLPHDLKPAARYLAYAAKTLLNQISRGSLSISTARPRLGIGRRLLLVLRARLGI